MESAGKRLWEGLLAGSGSAQGHQQGGLVSTLQESSGAGYERTDICFPITTGGILS
jgi:hypothetical protein